MVSLLQLASSRVDNYGGWNEAPNTQYHIQTDEGQERYFKYQTKTGQYRKEKRLEDGTVVGTYGWVDPNGYLRLRDYIADNAGYRILKSRMLFVGDGSDIGNSVVAAKNVPGSAGELVSPASSPFSTYSVTPNRAIYVPPLPSNNIYSHNQQPQRLYAAPVNTAGTTPSSTYRLQNLGPQYFPTTPSPLHYYTPSPTPVAYTASSQTNHIFPSTTPAPLYYSSTPSPQYHPSSTPAPTYYYSSTPSSIHYYPSSTPIVDIHHNAEPKYNGPLFSTTPAPPTSTARPIAVYSQTPRPIAVNYVSSTPDTVTASPTISAIGYTASTPSPTERPAPIAGHYARNNFITETEKNKLFYQYENNNRGYYRKRFVNYQPAAQEYDGISTVQNGFRYFLPKQYHEEQSSKDGQDRTGSFGYVDPFGIRRVVYYNTSPGSGFVHRKNNRYVGHNAAPYDPRPT